MMPEEKTMNKALIIELLFILGIIAVLIVMHLVKKADDHETAPRINVDQITSLYGPDSKNSDEPKTNKEPLTDSNNSFDIDTLILPASLAKLWDPHI